MLSWFSADFLFYLVSIVLGAASAHLYNWQFHRRLYSAECSLSDLEGKLLIEIKRRAGKERQGQLSLEREILDAAKNSEPAKPPAPWWSTIPGPRSFNG